MFRKTATDSAPSEPLEITSPENLEAELEKNNVIFLGVPQIGQTSLICEIIKGKDGVIITSAYEYSKTENAHRKDIPEIEKKLKKIDEIDVIPEEKLLFIDDFYRVFLECKNKPELLDKLKSLILSRKKGICVSTTPYRWEWLVEKEKIGIPQNAQEALYVVNEETTKKIIDSIPELRTKITEKYKTLDNYIKKSQYTYTYKSKKKKTYVPFFAIGIGGALTSAFLAGRVSEGVSEGIINAVYDKSASLFNKFPAAISFIAGGVTGGVSIGLFFVLRDLIRGKKGTVGDFAENFKALQELPPCEIELIETKKHLKPLTLFEIRDYFEPGRLEEIEKELGEVEGLKEGIIKIEPGLEVIIRDIREHDEKLSKHDEKVGKQLKKISTDVKKMKAEFEKLRRDISTLMIRVHLPEYSGIGEKECEEIIAKVQKGEGLRVRGDLAVLIKNIISFAIKIADYVNTKLEVDEEGMWKKTVRDKIRREAKNYNIEEKGIDKVEKYIAQYIERELK